MVLSAWVASKIEANSPFIASIVGIAGLLFGVLLFVGVIITQIAM